MEDILYRYIIYESKSKGKEYDAYNDRIIYKGEYLNGERNGKGKEYNYNNELIFKGNYIKGKRNGIGKEYLICRKQRTKSLASKELFFEDVLTNFGGKLGSV